MRTLDQYVALSRRAVVTTFRQPTSILPAMTFPLLFMALSSAAFERSTNLPGFPPVESFLQFLIATSIVQGTLFGSVAAGTAMATDIENGFFERLIAAPSSRASILVGRVMGAAVLAFVQAWVFMGVGMLFGLTVESGVLGMLLIALSAGVLGAGVGAIAMSFALRTGSAEAVQGSFPLLFAGLFLSGAFFPRDLMDGWFKTVAGYNPFTYLIEGLRALVIEGLDAGELATAIGVAGAIFVAGMVLSSAALRRRVAVAA
ncbi:MAG TPA: ABC transporter permease [Actinomycetota bacterium]|nr:ABC transporter permease [Actinomycetota bacterium]